MKLKPRWEAGIRAELQDAISRTCKRVALADPWHRALACCATAQRIREKRTRHAVPPRTDSAGTPAICWGAALTKELQRARQVMASRREKGSWDYALKLKLTGWQLNAKVRAIGVSFGHAS